MSVEHLLSLFLVIMEETILIHRSFQEPVTGDIQPSYRYRQGGRRRGSSLRNPTVIWQRDSKLIHEEASWQVSFI